MNWGNLNRAIASAGLLALPSMVLAASPGDLVTSFGTEGVVKFESPPSLYAAGLAIDADGRILGLLYRDTVTHDLLFRFNDDGTPDGDFGDNGFVELSVPSVIEGENVLWTALAPAPDGSVALFGGIDDTVQDFDPTLSILRVAADGTAGSVTGIPVDGFTPVAGERSLYAVDVQRWSGGYVVALEYHYDVQQSEIGLLWLTPDFELREGGMRLLKDENNLQFRELVVDANGNAWVLHNVDPAGATHSVVSKFQPDGAPDTAFGNLGVAEIADALGVFRTLAVTPSGRLLLVGESVLALTSAGEVDVTYGEAGTGVADTGAAADCLAREARALADGSLQYAGTISPAPEMDICLVSVDPEGAMDDGFGTDGMSTLHVQSLEGGWALSYADNGDIVLLSDLFDTEDGMAGNPLLTRHHGLFPDISAGAVAFDSEDDVDTGILVTSAARLIEGLGEGVAVPVMVENGEYSISSGAWTDEPGWARNGDQVAVRHTSSATAGSTVSTTLTIGGWRADDGESIMAGTQATFTSTTKPADPAGGGDDNGGGGGGSLFLLLFPLLLLSRYRPHA